ncbi:uncharacterized protein LOC108806123 isoform X2 [Raphanus sativus]|uniref:30S ribosomal protein S16, chloroplastic n=1 Tax=Raphanus sativus TaxID=3726 RepID=A0A9W3C279_RAPSA|nr:uncharacterized protein LOC108806123 isoform X2 [Raphanus sativus]
MKLTSIERSVLLLRLKRNGRRNLKVSCYPMGMLRSRTRFRSSIITMDAKGKGKMVEELPMMGESFTSSESLPLLAATDHETDHEDVGDAKVTISLGELQIGESLTSNESLPLLATEHAEEVVLLDLPPLVVDNNVHIDHEAQEEVEENVLPDVGAHNIRNVRGRPKRRPFTEPLSPRSQARSMRGKPSKRRSRKLRTGRNRN